MLDKLIGRTTPPTAVVDSVNHTVVHDYSGYPQVTSRHETHVRHEEPPLPVQYGTFAGIGRDPGHQANEHDLFMSLAFSEWLGVMGWPYGVARIPAELHIAMNSAPDVNPVRERFDIASPTPTPIGDRTAAVAGATTVVDSSFLGFMGSPLQKVM